MEQRSDQWFAMRAGKITASRMSDVMAKKTTAAYNNYRAQLVAERLTGEAAASFTSAAMQHGTDTEPEARAAYEFYMDVEVVEEGFVIHPEIEHSGASPDGLVGDDGLIEIKCPNTATHIDTLTSGKIANKYIQQMQWQMACTGREWCDFVSYDPRMPEHLRCFIRRGLKDDKAIAELEAATRHISTEADEIINQLNDINPTAGEAAA